MKHSLAFFVAGLSLLSTAGCMGQDIQTAEKDSVFTTVAVIPVIKPHLLWSKYLPAPNREEQVAKNVRKVYQDKKGNLWIGTKGEGTSWFDGGALNKLTSDDGLIDDEICSLLEDSESNIWFATPKGISKFNGKTFTNYTMESGLSDNMVISLFQDSKGVIWAGTKAGLCLFNGVGFTKVQLHSSIVGNAKSLSGSEVVTAIVEDKLGNLWFGTDGGGIYNFDGHTFTNITKEQGFADNRINSMLVDWTGNIWIGTKSGGLVCYNARKLAEPKGLLTRFTEADGIGNNNITNIYQDKAGNIWFSAENAGVYRYNGKTLQHFGPNEGLNIKSVQTIYEDSRGFLWIGGNGGLYRLGEDSFYNVKKEMLLDGC